ncbi:MAG: glycosyltransferase [Candidatus Micrarchaeia archaeon]|jgi:glycosyltransferase involved in cell wall biosynthesis
MKILVLAYHFPPIVASVNRTLNIVNELSKKHEVIVISAKKTNLDYVDETIKIPNEIQVMRTFNKNNSITQILTRIIKILPDGELWSIFVGKEVERICNEFKPDIIYSSIKPGYISIISYNIFKKMHIPYILDYRDPWEPPHLFKKMHIEALQNAKAIITVTEGYKDTIKKQCKRTDIKVIEGGISIEELNNIKSKKNNDNLFHIVYAGAITPRHKIDILLDSVGTLSKNDKNQIVIDIIGKSRSFYFYYEYLLKQKAKKYKLNINFFGYLSKDQTYSMIKNADLAYNGQGFVFSNAIGGKTYEYIGLEIPLLILSKKNNELSNFVKYNNIGIIAYSEKELTKKIEEVLNKKINLKEFKKNERKIKKDFSWEKICKKLEKIITSS